MPTQRAQVGQACSASSSADPRSIAERDRSSAAVNWRNLLIVSGCGALDLCIWDAGYVEVMIPATNLAAGRLEDLYAMIESS